MKVTELQSFKNDDGGYSASLRMANGDPCFISVSQSGIVVKKSRWGIVGMKLYQNKNLHECADFAKALSYLFPENRLPDAVQNPILSAVINAILHCENLQVVTDVLNGSINYAETTAGQRIDETPPLPVKRFPFLDRPAEGFSDL